MPSSRHHVLHDRVQWNAVPLGKRLRCDSGLIVPLDRDTHDELHDECPAVPLLGFHALRNTLNYYNRTNNPIRNVDNLMLAIEKSANHYKSHPIDRELGLLAVEAIDLQRPYLLQ